MTKVQLTFTDQEVQAIYSIGSKYGYNLPKTLKFIVGREAARYIDDSNLPTYEMSKKNENQAIKTLKEHRQRKTVKLNKPSDIGLL
ncbi:hypothetical protein HYU91_01955 [Candidatus Collierbacteria bacterium]|nr:hypothetical protein [Candidatus Collierbacteria bacterium]